jgi:hypothetical protein
VVSKSIKNGQVKPKDQSLGGRTGAYVAFRGEEVDITSTTFDAGSVILTTNELPAGKYVLTATGSLSTGIGNFVHCRLGLAGVTTEAEYFVGTSELDVAGTGILPVALQLDRQVSKSGPASERMASLACRSAFPPDDSIPEISNVRIVATPVSFLANVTGGAR